jgi:hypothetical protein
MKKLAFFLSVAAITLMTFTGCDDDDDVSPLQSDEFKTFNEDMRVLWSDHVLWTRNVVINIIDGTPGTTEAVNRLLQNQEDIGDAIKPYYGDANGDALTELLREHITIAADLLTAAKNGDTPAYDAALAAWYVNADEIAVFLNTANPSHFPLALWKSHMKEHLDLTLEEAVARLQGNYSADVAAFDQIYEQAMMMADMLAEGIANQFPDKF